MRNLIIYPMRIGSGKRMFNTIFLKNFYKK
jgi:hypothetical protein